MQAITMSVTGMSCQHCVNAIEGALGKLDGIQSAKVELAANHVFVTYDDSKISVDTIKETIEEQGYDVVSG
ncbi:copper chaperone CopZ [Brevibacillus centrosporus]|jgi:copper chaperone|uniref:copper chaperone CopZ n=1 Tax=Brevibacillus centrosporus TaxID=54910 RepID=UPI003987BBCA